MSRGWAIWCGGYEDWVGSVGDGEKRRGRILGSESDKLGKDK